MWLPPPEPLLRAAGKARPPRGKFELRKYAPLQSGRFALKWISSVVLLDVGVCDPISELGNSAELARGNREDRHGDDDDA